MNQNLWQLCPKCNGEGIAYIQVGIIDPKFKSKCDVCNGQKIISQLTGQPPQIVSGHFNEK